MRAGCRSCLGRFLASCRVVDACCAHGWTRGVKGVVLARKALVSVESSNAIVRCSSMGKVCPGCSKVSTKVKRPEIGKRPASEIDLHVLQSIERT